MFLVALESPIFLPRGAPRHSYGVFLSLTPGRLAVRELDAGGLCGRVIIR